MWRLAAAVVAVLVLWAASPAEAQPRTTPPTMDLRCYGYDGTTTRAYNCIPEESQQHHMRTFVPPVGSTCNGGQIQERPAGRIIFQIRCQKGTTPTQTTWSRRGTGPDFFRKPASVERVRITSRFSGSAGNFIVRCTAPRRSLIVNELIGSSFGNDGTTGVYRMANCTDVEVDTEQAASWEFRQDGARTAFTPARSWEGVTGAGANLPVEALASLATAVEVERMALSEVGR